MQKLNVPFQKMTWRIKTIETENWCHESLLNDFIVEWKVKQN